jgi:hypothetical protein
MPLFAGLLLSLCNALASVFIRFMSIEAAVKLAAYVSWIGLLAALLSSVYVCLSSLYGFASALFSGVGGSSGFLKMFFMGLGLFIPANAGAVMSCVASVWLATNIFRVQSFAIRNFHGGGALVA